VPSVTFYNAANTTDASQFPISGWQGIKAGDTPGQYLISGTSHATGILYVGSIDGKGTSYPVNYPGASQTSVYGVNNLGGNQVQLVGSYVNSDSTNRHGFFFQGTYGDGGVTGTFSTLDVPGAAFNYIHSTMGGLAVGNSDGPTASGLPLGPGKASIWNVETGQVVANVKFPGSISNTAYGIWYNGGTSYTIVGGFSKLPVNNMSNQEAPIGTGYIVDYNSATGRFSHRKAMTYPIGFNLLTHFEGISSEQPGVYQLAADSVQLGSGHLIQGSWVVLKRNRNGSFGKSSWVDLNYPGVLGWTSNDSVAGNQVVGIVFSNTGAISYQATVNTAVDPASVKLGRRGFGCP
jgi:trimeric autotransporter adhesin